MFTAKEICDFATELENSCCNTLDGFMLKCFGLDWWKDNAACEVKICLDAIMERTEEVHPNGYKMVNWLPR